MSVSSVLSEVFSPVNTYMWYIAFIFLIGLGVIFTIRLKGLQILKIHESAKLATSGISEGKKDKHMVSSFEAFCIGMGARIGVGNIAGVATAIVTGGPGAVFWMWIFAIIGSASSFMESTVAQIYKEKKSDGSYHGGPAYYATKGLRNRKIGLLLAFLIIVTFGIGFVGVQATNASAALCGAFDFENNALVFGIIIASIAAIVIFGGVKRIAKFSANVVPIMAFVWIAFALVAILLNINGVVNAIQMIFHYAFSAPSLIGGGIGTIIMVGMKRGIFSNEAGLGSVANVAATAKTTHPCKQGMIQSFGVLVDTLLVCTVTAFVILSYGNFDAIMDLGVRGAPLVQAVVSSTAIGGIANYIIAIFMFIFAFTSLIGYYTMSESNVRFIKDDKRFLFAIRLLIIIVAFLSCLISTSLMDLICDTFMAFMGAVNIIVIGLLSKQVMEAYRDYRQQKKAGIEEPEFHRSVLSDPHGVTEWE